MIDLLKNYKELHNSSGYTGSVRYQIAKKKLDTLFVKWLFNHQNKVQELLQKSKNNDLQSTKQPPPLFHQRIPIQNTSINPINPNIPFNNTLTTPPRGLLQSVELNHRISLNETYTPNLGKSTYLTKSINQELKINMQEIPQFYFPNGKSLEEETQLQYQKKIDQIFKQNFDVVKKLVNEVLSLPIYFSYFLLKKYTNKKNQITKNQFMEAWKQLKSKQIPKRAFLLLTSEENKKYLKVDDFKELLIHIMTMHPGLDFLKDTPEFQEWYSICVINRMFFIASEKNDFKMTFREFKKSPILNSLFQIQSEPDINLNRSFFCYEDFYVIYIKFWELDTVHDFFLTKEELSKYSGYTLSRKTVQRVFSQVAKKFQDPEKMTFGDFVWFIFCVEDKTHPKSIQYWFKILDLDNNGIVTGYELEAFFEEQTQRLAYMQNASSDFNYENIICQMVDLLKPKNNLQFTLDDFLRCKNECGVFINFMTDLNKIIAYEQRDAYEERNEKVSHPDWTEWQRFVKPEYKRVEQGEQVINWENDE